MPADIQNGYDIAKGLIDHKINPVLAVSMVAEPEQQADLALFIESLRLPPLPVQRQFYANGRPKPVQPPKPDKVKETTYRCLAEAARAKRNIRTEAKKEMPSKAKAEIFKGKVLRGTLVLSTNLARY